MKKVKIVSCTQQSDYKKTTLYKSLQQIQSATEVYFDDIHFYTENKESLSKRYNQYLERNKDKDSIVVFAHDDACIEDGLIVKKLRQYHEQYDIIGVAGGVNLQIKAPALWHIMCGGFGPNLRGFAGHYIENTNQSFITNFGPTPARVTVIDGLFMSVNTETASKTGWKFNENYSFHHYDIASCLDANTKKLKIGVVPIWVTHHSHGLREYNKVFTTSQETFLEEYKSY
jgi:hypothetical protein